MYRGKYKANKEKMKTLKKVLQETCSMIQITLFKNILKMFI